MDIRARNLSLQRFLSRLALLSSLALLSFGANAGDASKGKELSAVCASCHGAWGNESVTPDIPVLAGQHYTYLVRSLKDYRSGARNNLVMQAFVKDLTDQDIEDISAWYSQQDSSLHSPKP